MFSGFGAPEAIILILVLLLLFGGRKLPELARGSGRALRIFKSETKGLMDDEDEVDSAKKPTGSTQAQLTQSPDTPPNQATTPPTSAETLPPTHTETDR